jgi:hypothetical protein
MLKVILLIIFLGYTGFVALAQSKSKKKEWQIIVIGKEFRAKAILQNVTDSSVILLFRKKQTDEINFTSIEKIKLRPRYNESTKRLIGFFAGGIAGGIIIGTALSSGREGEPAALAGVVGGIGGGLLVGIAGALTAPMISNIFSARNFIIIQDSIYYQRLPGKLKPYCLIQ